MPVPEQKRKLVTELPGPISRKLHARREAEIATGFGIALPVSVVDAGGAIIVDADGNHLIDLASGIAVTSVGASHPDVVAKVTEQAGKFTHTCFVVTGYEVAVDVARTLNRLTPGDYEKRTCLFTTGAEAVENAIKIARTYTRRSAVVVLSHAYHGRTLLTMTMTGKNVPYKEGFGPYAPCVYRVPSPYPYRWTGENAGQEAYDQLVDIITTQIGAHNVAAIIAEPIQGEGGFIVPPEGYLPRLAAFAKKEGIVFIADEIQTGLGRTGTMFAVDHERIVPDMITTAKALAAGLPLSAVTGRAEIMDSVAPGGLGGTFAGNPVACAAAQAALGVIVRDDLPARARRIEEISRPRLEALVGPSSWVGEVRGRGAMLAMEFVQPGTKQPAVEAAKKVAAFANCHGILTLTCGTYGNVIRLLPPLVIDEQLLTDALDVLEAGVASLS